MAKFILFILMLLLAATPTQAQSVTEPEKKETSEERLARLEKEIGEVREELAAYREGEDARSLDRRRRIRVYGDVSLRWYMLNSSGDRATFNGESGKINRPEYRAHVGVTGYILDEFKHRTKYNVRLSNEGFAEYDAPLGSPAVSYRPFEAFGSTTSVQLDRFWIRHEYKRFLYLGAGRWQNPLRSTEMLFDADVGFTGVWASLDLGRVGNLYESGDFDDWRDFGEAQPGISRLFLNGAAYYLAQDNLGVPQKRGNEAPHGFSMQMASKVRFGTLDAAWIFAAGIHHFEGIDAVAANVGTGNTLSTTNQVNPGGDVAAHFTIFDALAEVILYEKRSASFKATMHYAFNMRAEDGSVQGDEDASAYYAGLQWGALVVEEAKEFQLSYSYVYVESNSLIPQFNHEEINTNFKGHRVSVVVALATGLVVNGGLSYGKRIDPNIMGVGRMSDGLPGSPSSDNETRIHFGVGLRF